MSWECSFGTNKKMQEPIKEKYVSEETCWTRFVSEFFWVLPILLIKYFSLNFFIGKPTTDRVTKSYYISKFYHHQAIHSTETESLLEIIYATR